MNNYNEYELNELARLLVNEEEQQSFSIKDKDTLSWALRKLSIIKQEEAAIASTADREIERVMAWSERERNKVNRGKEFLEAHIQRFHTEELANNPKAKTISTPYGKTKARKESPKIKETNREALIEYVMDNNLEEFMKMDIKWNDLKKTLSIADIGGDKVVITKDGEIIAGVEVTEETISYSVEVE